MRPSYQTSSFVLILGIVLLLTGGCGKKHLHVSTMSGAPGEEELAMELDTAEDQSGLDSSALDESGLGNQQIASDESLPDDLEPLDFTTPTAPPTPTQGSDSSTNDDLLAGLDKETNDDRLSGFDSGSNLPESRDERLESPEQEIQSQSPSSFPVNPTGEGFDNSLLGEENDSNLDTSESDDLAPLTAFNTPDDSDFSNFGNDSEESRLPVEQIPGNIAVAKAEPSEAIRNQLEKFKTEEKAAREAGISDVFFEFDSWALTAEGRQALEQGAEWLHDSNAAKLLVEGHCDSRGTQAYNLILGKKRAGAIRDYLVELGITPERVSIISYGQDKPFCSDPTEVCYQLNRRGHLLVQHP